MRPPLRSALSAIAVVVLLVASGCSRSGMQEILAHRLFSLSLGRLEDQVDLFQPEGQALARRNRIHMRDGLFYVANGNAGKIMVFSSYGELLLLLYNAATNPAPVLVTRPAGDDTLSTRGAVAYPFQDIGEIAVSSDKTLYVEDAAPEARVVRDDSDEVSSRIVLRFDRRGMSQGYLGQEGVGGTPFPFITGLSVTQRDQPVVVCRRPAAWEVFWYTRTGELLYRVMIDDGHLPPPPASDLQASVVGLTPDPQEPVLYLLLYYYHSAPEPAGRSSSNSGGVVAMLHRFDLRSRRYERSIELPVNPSRKERVGFKTEEILRPPYDLLGVGPEGQLYLLGYADTNLYNLVLLGSEGRIRGRAYMVIEDTELTFRDLHLSPEGIAYALLCDQRRASVSWWRTDQLATGELR